MKFEFYNPTEEKGSCIIRTFTKLLNKEPNKVKQELIELAKELNYDSYKDIEVFEEYFNRNNYEKIHTYDNKLIKNIELEQGKYAIFCYDKKEYYHIFAVVDNVVYDKSSSCFELYVISTYRLK